MHVEDFLVLVGKDLDAFKSNWYFNNKDEPENWPLDGLNMADWMEQLQMFFEDRGHA